MNDSVSRFYELSVKITFVKNSEENFNSEVRKLTYELHVIVAIATFITGERRYHNFSKKRNLYHQDDGFTVFFTVGA
jgi:hypothetical protein